MTLYLTILPMTLVAVPNAVDTITDAIKNAGLVPEQIILGVSETEVIPGLNDFTEAVKQLKQAGISLSIDNFGDGSAGLSLLTHVQPDRVRIASGIIRDVHRSGPKQAVVQAIIKCCSALEINVIASGIEQPEEWMWLEAAGVIDFQGSALYPAGTSVSWRNIARRCNAYSFTISISLTDRHIKSRSVVFCHTLSGSALFSTRKDLF